MKTKKKNLQAMGITVSRSSSDSQSPESRKSEQENLEWIVLDPKDPVAFVDSLSEDWKNILKSLTDDMAALKYHNPEQKALWVFRWCCMSTSNTSASDVEARINFVLGWMKIHPSWVPFLPSHAPFNITRDHPSKIVVSLSHGVPGHVEITGTTPMGHLILESLYVNASFGVTESRTVYGEISKILMTKYGLQMDKDVSLFEMGAARNV